MKNNIKIKINSLLQKIKSHEKDKAVQRDLFFSDPALIAHKLAEEYETLANLYITAGEINKAKKAFEKAKKYSIIFAKLDLYYNKKGKELTEALNKIKFFWQKRMKAVQKTAKEG